MSNSEYIYFLNLVYQEFGLNLAGYEEKFLRRRIEKRLRTLDCDSYEGYLHIVMREPLEYKKLLDEIGINVTEFFRDPTMWKVVGDKVLPDILTLQNLNSDRKFHFWSSACNTGEEAFSLAILTNEYVKHSMYMDKIDILATDIVSEVIRKAGKRQYIKDRIHNVGPNILSKYFKSLGRVDDGRYCEEMYELNEDVSKVVNFKECDLLNDFSYAEKDIILCRNVLIYFTKRAQTDLIERFYKSLRPGGYLILGKCETLCEEASTKFKPINIRERVFQKR